MSSPSKSAPSSPGPSKESLKSLEESKDTVTPSSSESSEENASATQEPTQTSSGTPSETTNSESVSPSSNPWQAIYSQQYNAYYFFNAETQETTWQNPLQPTDTPPTASTSTSTSTAQSAGDTSSSVSAEIPVGESADGSSIPSSSSSSSSYNALQAAALAQGIDPSLAYLDPSLAASVRGPSSSNVVGAYGATAKFNARTGQFTRVDARDPSHLSEYERAKRMSEFYFDVNAWETERAQEQEAEVAQGGDKKRKRPSKKDLERFKEQKRQKKIAKTAWLRT